MTAPKPATPIRKAPLFTPYVVIWSMFGTLSLGLLMVLGLAPEWLDDLRPGLSVTDPQSNQGQRATAKLASDVNAIKDSVAKIQLDLAKVKTDVASQNDQNKAVKAQVTALETRFEPGTTVAKAVAPAAAQPVEAPTQVQVQVQPQSQSPAGTALPAPGVAPVAAPAQAQPLPAAQAQAPARVPKVINADAATGPVNALETGSVAAAAKAAANPISFGPAVVKAAPQPLGVKISSGASADSLRLSWSLLAEKHGDTLKGLEARYRTGGDTQNPDYDLIAGPIKSKAEAAKVCKSLAAKGVPCTVGAFGGEAL